MDSYSDDDDKDDDEAPRILAAVATSATNPMNKTRTDDARMRKFVVVEDFIVLVEVIILGRMLSIILLT